MSTGNGKNKLWEYFGIILLVLTIVGVVALYIFIMFLTESLLLTTIICLLLSSIPFFYKRIKIDRKNCITYEKGIIKKGREGFKGDTLVTVYLYDDKITFNDIQTIPLSRVQMVKVEKPPIYSIIIYFINSNGKEDRLMVDPVNNNKALGRLAKKINELIGYYPVDKINSTSSDNQEPFDL